jgi:predicted double-glycine peptidase
MGAYLMALAILCLFGIERYTVGLELVPPFCWVAAGRLRYVLAAFVGPVLLLTPAAKLPRRRDKALIGTFAGLFLIGFVCLPLLLPALVRPVLAALSTKIDPDGVCIQQTSYTCGAAAAVTGLRRLGLDAQEGQLAIWSHTSQFGTTPDELAAALESHYKREGLAVRYRRFKSVAELREASVTLAVVKYDMMTDHFVTVLGVTDQAVIIGDPLSGRAEYSYDDFAKVWRFSGVTLSRGSKSTE